MLINWHNLYLFVSHYSENNHLSYFFIFFYQNPKPIGIGSTESGFAEVIISGVSFDSIMIMRCSSAVFGTFVFARKRDLRGLDERGPFVAFKNRGFFRGGRSLLLLSMSR